MKGGLKENKIGWLSRVGFRRADDQMSRLQGIQAFLIKYFL